MSLNPIMKEFSFLLKPCCSPGGYKPEPRPDIVITGEHTRLMTLYSTLDMMSSADRIRWAEQTRIHSYRTCYLLEQRGKALKVANVHEGTEAWRRIVAPTVAEYDEKDRLGRVLWDASFKAAKAEATAKAHAFAELGFDIMVWHYSPSTHPEIWKALTSQVPIGRLLIVEREARALIAREDEMDHRSISRREICCE